MFEEFIRLLKEDFKEYYNDSMDVKTAIQIIEKRAGSKLIVPQAQEVVNPVIKGHKPEGVDSPQDGVKVAQVPHEHQVGKFDSSSCDNEDTSKDAHDVCDNCGYFRFAHDDNSFWDKENVCEKFKPKEVEGNA